MPRSYLYFGFTTVLELVGNANMIKEWNAQDVAPQAHFCAPVIIPNGYPASWMDKTAQFQAPAAKYMLFDPQQTGIYPSDFLEQEHSPSAVVRKAKQDGARCIKVFYETGFGAKKNLPVPSVELIQAVVAEAKLQALPVFLHGNSQAAYEFALKTGVNHLVHGLWHPHRGAENNEVALKQIADQIVQKHIGVQPTMQVLYGEQEIMNPAFFQDQKVQDAIPSVLANWYQSASGQWMKDILAQEVMEEAEDKTASPQQQYQMMQNMYQNL